MSNSKFIKILLLFSCIVFFESCHEGNSAPAGEEELQDAQAIVEFSNYWHQGKAEITSYKLEQARYGEMREGEAVLIFVTEDFSKSKQVKLDNLKQAGDDAVNVLKLNMTKIFLTGIYPYSMMLSVFTPFETAQTAHTLKVTASSQEWCGHTFTQINHRERHYLATLHSYFESEGEQQLQLPKVALEDELWTLIRLAPDKIPTGEMQMLPGLLSQRLRHTPLKPEKAIISIYENENMQNVTRTLSVNYPEQERVLKIEFKKAFPHEIENWEETYIDGFGASRKKLTSRAVKSATLFTDYWRQHSNADAPLRDTLKLKRCP